MARDSLGIFEMEAIRGVMAASPDAFGLSIVRQIELDTGRKPSIGATYTTLERLERKGYLTSRWGEASARRGGRRKRIYTVNAAGQFALRRSSSEANSTDEILGGAWQGGPANA